MNTELSLILITGFALVFLAAAIVGWRKALAAQQLIAQLKGEELYLNETIDRITRDIEAYKGKEELRLDAEKRASALDQQVKSHIEREAQREQELKAMQAQFENLAHKIFDAKQKTFGEQSQKGLNELLTPLKERFADFQKKVDETYGQHAKEQHHLKHEIARMLEMNQAMSAQTENLTKALKGDVKMQGTWGEIILEKVLEASGLRKGEHYILQGEGLGLKHVESGGHLRPDVIVHLPENKHLIIDSKVSLVSYERFISETDEAARALHLKAFLASLRAHVSGLESKRYQDSAGLSTPDFVLLFMPIESAYALAIQSDSELHAFAWDKRIFLVSPSTLYPILRTVASIWRMDLQHKNSEEIAKRGGALYDKIAGFVEDMQKLGKQLTTTQGTYDDAMNKLSVGRGNILRQTEALSELGAKHSKQLPVQLIEAESKESA